MHHFVLFCSALLILFAPLNVYAREESIAAVVNQDAISMTDFTERMKLIAISSGLPNTPEIRAKLTPQIISSLIEEQLMIQEARKRNLTVTDADIERGFAELASQNKTDPAQFKKMITGSGIDINTMKRQISAQLGWSKVIQKVMRPQVTVTDADIDDEISRISASKGKQEYLLAEILLPVDGDSNEADVKQLADKLAIEIRNGKAPFSKVAQQFSKAPGASKGGDLGWVQEGQLQQELDSVIKTLNEKDISNPIRTASGYHILLLRGKRALSDESMPSREQVMSNIGLQRLDRMQRRYLMDLKTSAFIENRVQS